MNPWKRERKYRWIQWTPKEMIWRNVRLDRTTGCWNWQGHTVSDGYGSKRVNGRKMHAHRLSYLAFVGDIPSKLLVCHSCDNPACCNPEHLFLGTNTDNMRDMFRKGRANRAQGERNGATKLTAAQVRAIRAQYTGRSGQQTELAREFQVYQSTISSIVLRKTWIRVI
jgi:hypothetical protein